MATATHQRLFNSKLYSEPRSWGIVRRVLLALFSIHMVLATISGYRAIVQVKSLELIVADPILRPGVVLEARGVSWARTHVRVRLMLEQRARVETLAVTLITSNTIPAWDFRLKRGEAVVQLTPEQLQRFEVGPAMIRATAIGGPQWFRTPPPLVREAHVTIAATR